MRDFTTGDPAPAAAHPAARTDPEVDDLVRALRDFGVLTRDLLRECSGALTWPDHNFGSVLERGVAEGAIKSLGAGLFEVGDRAPDLNDGKFGPP
jgi:hypothetical protein